VEENFIKRLMASIKCAVCGQPYNPDDVSIIGQEEEFWLLRVYCSACHTKCLVAVATTEDTALERATNLAEVRLDRLRSVGVPTAADVLSMHDFLQDFDGDFSRLFTPG